MPHATCPGVGEVLHARHAGEGEAGDVEGVVGVGAGQPDLLVAVGALEPPVRVPGDHRHPAGGAPAADGPGVAARLRPAPRGGTGRRPPARRWPAGGGATACPARCRRARGGRRRPPAASTPATARAGARSRPARRRSAPRRAPRSTPSTYAATKARASSPSPSYAVRAIAVRPGPPGEAVPRQTGGSDDLGGAALGLQPGPGDLPETVGDDRPALLPGDVERRAGHDVRDPPAVTSHAPQRPDRPCRSAVEAELVGRRPARARCGGRRARSGRR